MRRVLLDTSGLIAVSFRTEAAHAAARRQMTALAAARARFVMHQGITIELLETLASVNLRHEALRILDSLQQDAAAGNLEVYELSGALVDRGLLLFRSRPDQEWGLTDCISFVLMRELQLSEAFTLDHHFEQAGFVRLIHGERR